MHSMDILTGLKYGVEDLVYSINMELKKVKWLNRDKNKKEADSEESKILKIKNLLVKFHLIVRKLQLRHETRTPFHIKDEYDVQDLLFALLHIYFDDIRREEYTSSQGGSSSRIDFLLKNEKIVVETKMPRAGLTNKKLADELSVDMIRYQAHPDCKTLICFVYDPKNIIQNPIGFEKDLSRKQGNLEVYVIVVQH